MVTQLPPPLNQSSNNPLTHFIHNIISIDGNIMLAAIISLLLVILFVSILHVYAKWFLGQARYNHTEDHRTRNSSSVSMPGVLGSRFHHFHTFTIETTATTTTTTTTTISSDSTKGLEASVISKIPLFVYKEDNDDDDSKQGLECVICLAVFEDTEIGRKLPNCGHAFHVECIDMWLHSHSTCPICRASVVVGDDGKIIEISSTSSSINVDQDYDDHHRRESVVEIVVEIPIAEHCENVIVASSSASVYCDSLPNANGVLEIS